MRVLPSAVALALAASLSTPLFAAAKRPAGITPGRSSAPGQAKKIDTDAVGALDFASDDALEIDVQLEPNGKKRTFKRQNPKGRGGKKQTSDAFVGTADDGAVMNMIKARGGKSGQADHVVGTIHGADDAVYSLQLDADGEAFVVKTMNDDFPPELEPEEEDGDLSEADQSRAVRSLLRSSQSSLGGGRNLQEGTVIDVLVVWTDMAECDRTGLSNDGTCIKTEQTTNNMHALIKLAVAETNTAYDLSGVDAQLRLVGAYRDSTVGSSYDDSAGFSAALGALRSGSIGGSGALREELGADVVALIVGTSGSCGIGYLGPRKDLMFTVTADNCATGYFSFGHEIGHNMGCNHDRGTKTACTNTNTNYGWRSPNEGYRTILSYSCKSGQCDAHSGSYCSRIQRFSTMDTNYNYNGKPIGGKAGGAAGSDNAAHLNSKKGEVANYYTALTDPCTACSSGLVCMDDGSNRYCGTAATTATTTTTTTTPECSVDANCADNGIFCDGTPKCVGNVCVPGDPVVCPSDSIDCTVETCTEGAGGYVCVSAPSDSFCEDGIFCNGAETCDPAQGGCIAGTAVNCDDPDPCTIDSCNENDRQCDNVPKICPGNGLFCDGVERCDSANDGECSSPGNPCVVGEETCDEAADKCVQCAADADCSAGLVCDALVSNRCVECTANSHCDDGNLCTIDSCDQGSNTCAFVPTTCGGPFCDGVSACDEADGLCKAAGNPCVGTDFPVCLETTDECVECTATDPCSEGQCKLDTNECVQCVDDAPCSASGEVCKTTTNQCVQCVNDVGCSGTDNDVFCDGAPICGVGNVCQGGPVPCAASETCDETNAKCVECLVNSNCPGSQVCDTVNDRCVECLTTSDCSNDGVFCNGATTCNSNNVCQTGSAPCTGSNQVCNESTDSCNTCKGFKQSCSSNSDCCSSLSCHSKKKWCK